MEKSLALKIKRVFDFIFSLLVLIIISPVLIVLAIGAWLSLGLPIFFLQPRAGYYGRVFNLIKFRSMTNERGPEGELLPNEERLTAFGKFIRSTSLDELPQFINVLLGDLSVVGPRPLPVRYLEIYNERQALRHNVRPGITGWSQVGFRGERRTWEERLEQDVWYVENWSLGLDLKIIVLTFWVLLLRILYRRERQANAFEEFIGETMNDAAKTKKIRKN